MTPAILPANEVERLLDVTLSVLGRTTCTAPHQTLLLLRAEGHDHHVVHDVRRLDQRHELEQFDIGDGDLSWCRSPEKRR